MTEPRQETKACLSTGEFVVFQTADARSQTSLNNGLQFCVDVEEHIEALRSPEGYRYPYPTEERWGQEVSSFGSGEENDGWTRTRRGMNAESRWTRCTVQKTIATSSHRLKKHGLRQPSNYWRVCIV